MWAVSGNPCRQRARGPSVGPVLQVGELQAVGRDGADGPSAAGCRSWPEGSPTAHLPLRLACSPCANHLLRCPGLVPVLVRPAAPLRGQHLLRAGRGRRRAAPRPRHGDGPARARPPPLAALAPTGRPLRGNCAPDPPALRPRAGHAVLPADARPGRPPRDLRPGPGRRLAAGDHGRHGQAAVLPGPHGRVPGRAPLPRPRGAATSSPSGGIKVKVRTDPPHRQHPRLPHRGRRRVRRPTCPTTRPRWTGRTVAPEVLELCDGVDLLIHDSQYTEEEFVELFDWGHSTAAYAVHVATQAGARAARPVPPRPGPHRPPDRPMLRARPAGGRSPPARSR